MRLPKLLKMGLLATILPVILMARPATAAGPGVVKGTNPAIEHTGPVPQLRITEITDSSHPFETLYCARQPVQVRYIGALAEVVIDDESRTLMRAMSASGARYVAPGDDTTELWGKGPLATITWSGEQLPVCAPSGTIIPPYRASGNEPFWSLSYDGWTATFSRPGDAEQTRDARITDLSATGQTLTAGEGPNAWRLEATDGLCIDSMSGMPRPQHATLHIESETLRGCGGSTDRLLQGISWQITHIGEQAMPHDATPHIRFLDGNKIAGSTGCNRFFGQYTLTGESLTLKDMGSTRMACPPEIMAQEQVLLKRLATVSRFSFEASDLQQLLLHADGVDIRTTAGDP